MSLKKIILQKSSTIGKDGDVSKSYKRFGHLPELDSLRTVAVVMVLLAHYLPKVGWRELPYARYGVDIFFTISGFLVTVILINALDNKKEKRSLDIVKRFMVRRALRLFPLYYLFILFFWILKNYFNVFIWRDEFTPYFLTYTPNWFFYYQGVSNGASFLHLWSLGVEEQFYLLWPWVLIICPVRYRSEMIIFFIAVALFTFGFISNPGIKFLPFANLHTLGAGALLACLYMGKLPGIAWLKTNRHLLFIITFVQLWLVLGVAGGNELWMRCYTEFSLCLVTFSIVLVTIYGWGKIISWFTKHPFVQYLGRISYGIYLFHLPLPALFSIIFFKYSISLPASVLFSVYVLTTVVLASLSYRFIEMPFLRLKRKFED